MAFIYPPSGSGGGGPPPVLWFVAPGTAVGHSVGVCKFNTTTLRIEYWNGAAWVDHSTWEAPVATSGALPLAGNILGDVRLVLDTGISYYWDGVAWQAVTPAIAWNIDPIVIVVDTFVGDTVYTLPVTPLDNDAVFLEINDVLYHYNIHFNIVGLDIIWNFPDFEISPTDTVNVIYPIKP